MLNNLGYDTYDLYNLIKFTKSIKLKWMKEILTIGDQELVD